MFAKRNVLPMTLGTLLAAAILTAGFASSASAEVPEKFQGLIVSAGAGQAVVMVGSESLMFVITDETKITLNKSAAKLEDLQKGQMASVMARRVGDQFLALTIDAKKAVIGSRAD